MEGVRRIVIDVDFRLARGGASSLPGQYYSNTGGPGSGTDWSGLVSYLNGTGVSDLSPLTLEAKYNQSRASLQSMIALAQGGDLDAISGLGGARDSFLGFSRQRNASSGQYNTDFFGSFNAGAALTGGDLTLRVQPPVGQEPEKVAIDGDGLTLLDNDGSRKSAAELLEAVAAETAIVSEKIMRKMLMRRRRRLPSTARTMARTSVAGTV